MTTITIQSNFQAVKLINQLKSEGVQFTYQAGYKKIKADPENVFSAVCTYYRIHPIMLQSKCRKPEFVHPRYVFYFITKKFNPKFSLKEIGKMVGGKDHATVINGIKTISEWVSGKSSYLPANVKIKNDINAIIDILNG